MAGSIFCRKTAVGFAAAPFAGGQRLPEGGLAPPLRNPVRHGHDIRGNCGKAGGDGGDVRCVGPRCRQCGMAESHLGYHPLPSRRWKGRHTAGICRRDRAEAPAFNARRGRRVPLYRKGAEAGHAVLMILGRPQKISLASKPEKGGEGCILACGIQPSLVAVSCACQAKGQLPLFYWEAAGVCFCKRP